MSDRRVQIEMFLSAVAPNWSYVTKEIDERLEGLILSLISQDSEETRGRIKALRDLKDLPQALTHELAAIKAELTE
jgi:hypothetical protein